MDLFETIPDSSILSLNRNGPSWNGANFSFGFGLGCKTSWNGGIVRSLENDDSLLKNVLPASIAGEFWACNSIFKRSKGAVAVRETAPGGTGISEEYLFGLRRRTCNAASNEPSQRMISNIWYCHFVS